MDRRIAGLHHVTAMGGSPQVNLDFYVSLLGLRLVKRTVNFDDPGTYHLYYGDEVGTPGTILTFFPWEDARQGRQGKGQAVVTSLSVPGDSLGFWVDRLRAHGVEIEEPMRRFDEEVIEFHDPDGLRLEIVAHPGAAGAQPWRAGPVPVEHSARGFHSVALCVEEGEGTGRLLTEVFGAELVTEDGNGRFRFRVGEGKNASFVDVLAQPEAQPGIVSRGTVHHIAFRARDDEEQLTWRRELMERGFDVTPVLDRQYFRSVYFREPGGVLFEIATDPPGFTWDEPVEELGSGLKLPPWLEQHRERIEGHVRPITVPGT